MTWLGHTAVYSDAEQRTMARIKAAGASVDELAFLHEAKARFKGTLKNPAWYWRMNYSGRRAA